MPWTGVMARVIAGISDEHEREPSAAASDTPLLRPSRGLREITRELGERAHQLRIRFEAAHAAILEALATNDYVTLRDMIDAERAIIDEQASLMKEHTQLAVRDSRAYRGDRH